MKRSGVARRPRIGSWTLVGCIALAAMCVVGGDAGAFSYFTFGAGVVRWANKRSTRELSPSTFPPGSDPDIMILESMGLWTIVPACDFVYFYHRSPQDFPIDNFDGYNDTIAVAAEELDPGVLGVTSLVNNGALWFDMDMLFSDFPEAVGYDFNPNPPCQVVTAPTPTNGFSFLLIAVHEMGHALGLGHDPIGNESPGTPWFITTMNPRYPSGGPIGQENIIELHTDDRNGARFLYPHSGPSEPAVRDLASAGYTSSGVIGKAVPVFFTPLTSAPGGILTARSVIENFGTTNQFFVRQGFYLSSDAMIQTGDAYLGSLEWDIAFQDAFEFDVDIDLPIDLAAGTYYLGSILDDLNQVIEAYEDNNAALYCTPLTIQRLAPVINNLNSVNATCGQPFTGPAPGVTKPLNMAPITWSLDNPQPGMTIHPATGVISWPSPIPAAFPYRIFVRATNSAGTSTTDIFIGVSATAPQISSIADQALICGAAYTGPAPLLTAPTCMNPIINWSLDTGPPGMTINFATGVVSWAGPAARAAPYTVTIRATNAAGNGTRTWLLRVPGADVNADGQENLLDAQTLASVLAGQDLVHAGRADLNCDGQVDGRDVAILVSRLIGS